MKITTHTKKILADTITPVGLYLKLRDQFQNSLLLESSDYHGNENNFSFICLDPILTFVVENKTISIVGLGNKKRIQIKKGNQVLNQLQKLIRSLKVDANKSFNGFYGYTNYEAVQFFESINLKNRESKNSTPIMHYSFFRYVIQIDHFKNELTVLENLEEKKDSEMDKMISLLKGNHQPQFPFKLIGKKKGALSDLQFKEMVKQGKKHCQLGDVFQIVLSRPFSQSFTGDEFNVYRALRSVNPSPYLFFFDFGSFKLFGSSPEAQLKVSDNKAILNPIAGTFKRTGNDQQDKLLAEKLANDPKENAEHTMLVDLARNDLGRSGKNVKVKTYKETQFYSHVIHLVSEVEAELDNSSNSLQMFANTFPAGTLSGAPKFKAMELIDRYESQQRGFYGGAIGFFGLDGKVNHAITIRSFLSKNNTLHFQAGAGVVVNSNEENELQEVNNKLKALQNALILAENI